MNSGAAGLINLISRFANGAILSGVFCILSTIGWAMQVLGNIWMYKQVRLQLSYRLCTSLTQCATLDLGSFARRKGAYVRRGETRNAGAWIEGVSLQGEQCLGSLVSRGVVCSAVEVRRVKE